MCWCAVIFSWIVMPCRHTNYTLVHFARRGRDKKKARLPNRADTEQANSTLQPRPCSLDQNDVIRATSRSMRAGWLLGLCMQSVYREVRKLVWKPVSCSRLLNVVDIFAVCKLRHTGLRKLCTSPDNTQNHSFVHAMWDYFLSTQIPTLFDWMAQKFHGGERTSSERLRQHERGSTWRYGSV